MPWYVSVDVMGLFHTGKDISALLIMLCILIYKSIQQIDTTRATEVTNVGIYVGIYVELYGATGLFLHSALCDNDNDITSCDKTFTFYLSQGSVSEILTLVYPCCGIWHIEGQNLHIPPFIYVCY